MAFGWLNRSRGTDGPRASADGPAGEKEDRAREDYVDPRLLVLGAILAAVMVVTAVVLPDLAGDRGEEGEIEPLVVLDPPRQPGQDALSVGVRPGALAPDFEVSTADGRRHKLSDFRGRPVLLTFWATWCLPCTTGRISNEGGLLFDLHALGQKYGDQLVIILVNRGESSGLVQSYLDRVTLPDRGRGVSVTVSAIDPDDSLYTKFYSEYGRLGMPSTFFINPDGLVTQVHDRRGDLNSVEEALATTRAPAPGG